MRARSLKPAIYKNFALAKLGDTAFRLFTGLWCMADRQGRLKDEPEKIQAELFPFRFQGAEMEPLLGNLAAGEDPFIIRYEAEGQKYIQIKNFSKHQRPHPREAPSTIPSSKKQAIPRHDQGNAKDMPSPSSSLRPSSSLTPSSLRPSGIAAAPQPYPIPDPKTEPKKCLVLSYKSRKGVPYDNRDWDKTNFARAMAAASGLLSLCKDFASAEECLNDLSVEYETKELSWTLETVARNAADWLKKTGRNDANASRNGLRMAIAKSRPAGKSESPLAKVSEGQIHSAVGNGEIAKD